LLVEGAGLPISLVVDGANRHAVKLLEAILAEIVIERPAPSEDAPQHLCLDKAYAAEWVYELLEELGYTKHLRSRSEEKGERKVIPGYRARRWKIERTHSWLNPFRRLRIRWEKKASNYLALLHLACALIVFRKLGFFG
jgi:putative transposase